MLILIICILVSTLISVIFKIYGILKLNVYNAIVINYWVCVITGSLVYQEWLVPLDFMDKPWAPYAIFLGFIFISIFNVVAHTIRQHGILVATIFQKMSLLAPGVVGIVFYQEANTLKKWIGILMAVLAIVLISWPKGKRTWQWSLIWLPVLTFVGSAIIEVTLFYVNIENIVVHADIRFVGSLFFCAGLFGLSGLILKFLKGNHVIHKKDLWGGIALGIPNFFSIYLILVLLDKGWEGSVLFPINNVGILTLASMAGILFFKEKLESNKIIGFALAIISMILISN